MFTFPLTEIQAKSYVFYFIFFYFPPFLLLYMLFGLAAVWLAG